MMPAYSLGTFFFAAKPLAHLEGTPVEAVAWWELSGEWPKR